MLSVLRPLLALGLHPTLLCICSVSLKIFLYLISLQMYKQTYAEQDDKKLLFTRYCAVCSENAGFQATPLLCCQMILRI